ncbi:pirin family protein [Lonsdalea quercina]|uniref:pirin family protein n=1 Tax=Lonsdalea quercina TaxID=71657 RepID=UPI0039757D5B
MIISRAAEQCGKADYGWLQARYTFSFGHYFEPDLLGFGSLRVLNQEVLAPKAAFQARTYPRVDILNILLQGEAEYRDNNGSHTQAKAGDVMLLATQPHLSYSEQNIANDIPLTRIQLWLDACPTRENLSLQRMSLNGEHCQLLASPDDENGSLHLRQQVWVYHLDLAAGESLTHALKGNRAYVQSIHGEFGIRCQVDEGKMLRCGDGAFIQQETAIALQAKTPGRALLIDLVV